MKLFFKTRLFSEFKLWYIFYRCFFTTTCFILLSFKSKYAPIFFVFIANCFDTFVFWISKQFSFWRLLMLPKHFDKETLVKEAEANTSSVKSINTLKNVNQRFNLNDSFFFIFCLKRSFWYKKAAQFCD